MAQMPEGKLVGSDSGGNREPGSLPAFEGWERSKMQYIDRSLKSKKLFLLDIDGTVSLDAEWIDGAPEFLNLVEENGGKYIFITNNSTKGIGDYVDKYRGMGLDVDSSNFLTASYVTACFLKEKHEGELIYVLGTKSFAKELMDFGLEVVQEVTEENIEKIRAAVVGFDNELTYRKVTDICRLLSTREVEYYATNMDLACPVTFGFVPDCGAICRMIACAVKREPEYIGKPNKLMVTMAAEKYGYALEDILVIGDRLYTDIACGINAGVDTLVVFTGEAKKEDLETTEFVPSYYCETIGELYNILSKNGV
jgi:HAD superfamily hydrolase (TIGR01450 family)